MDKLDGSQAISIVPCANYPGEFNVLHDGSFAGPLTFDEMIALVTALTFTDGHRGKLLAWLREQR